MISLRKHIDAYDRQLAEAYLDACCGVLEATGQAGAQAVPNLAGGFRASLKALQERLRAQTSTTEVALIQSDIETELTQWGESAEKSTKENLNQVKEIMMAVAASAAAIADRDHRYTNRFKQVTERLQSVAKVEDIRTMRRSVIESASEIKTSVQQMAEEGERALSQLKAEVDHYRSEIKEYQKRDSTDALTGLANRSAIDAQIQDRIEWSGKFCVAILDLNGFKGINDTHGHAAGDQLLKQFATEVRSRCRSTDVVGRWGGDEFVLVMDGSLEETSMLLNRLREWAFGEYDIETEAGTVQAVVTASVGVAEWNGVESALELFNRVDQLMYREKRTTSISPRVAGQRAAGAPSSAMRNAG